MAFVVGMGFSNKLVFADEQVTTPQVTTVAETTTEAETTQPTTTQPVTEKPTTTNNQTTGNQKKNYWVKTKKEQDIILILSHTPKTDWSK